MANILSIQLHPELGDKKTNLNKVKKILDEYYDKDLDLVLLPEFFSTGIHHQSMIEEPENETGGETIALIGEFAKKHNTNIIAGSVIEKSDNVLYNTSFVIDRCGHIMDKYRKIHLFSYLGGTENERITAGFEEKVVELDFAKVGLSICFDIRYPMHYRKLIQNGAEIIVCPTAWCSLHNEKELMIQNWKAFNIARACESLVYIISSNNVGGINDIITNTGNSLIVAPTGKILANAEEKECGIFAEIDLNIVRSFKKTYPVAQID